MPDGRTDVALNRGFTTCYAGKLLFELQEIRCLTFDEAAE